MALSISVCAFGGLVCACGGPEVRPCNTTTYLLPEDDLLRRVEYHYDDEGDAVGTTTLAGDAGLLVEEQAFVYNEDGQLMGEVLESHDDDGRIVVTTATFTFDDDERLVAEEWAVNDTPERRTEFIYDGDGHVAGERYYGAGLSPPLVRAVYNSYDDDDRIVSSDNDNDGDGQVDVTVSHTYTEDGAPLTIESVATDTRSVRRTTFVYDDDQRLIREVEEMDGVTEKATDFIYDPETGLLIAVEVDEGDDGTIERRRELAYDEEERLISEVELVSEDGGLPEAAAGSTSSRTVYDYNCWEDE